MNVFLTALGCRLNEAELQQWAVQLKGQQHAIVKDITHANVIVVNTCAVTGEAARKSRQLIRKLHRQQPAAKVVVTGCYASLEPEKVAEILGVDLVVPNDMKNDLVEQIIQKLDLAAMPEMATEPGEAPLFARNRDRAFIKVQDGCRYRCTYCIVTIARGDEKSRTIEDICDEVNRLYADGIREIVVAGVHVGGYGSDIDTNLYELIQAILSDTDIPRIRFASVEPWDLPLSFFELFKNPRVMPHMHLPIQSGCDSVLRRMARRCKTNEFAALIEAARQVAPEFNVTTDIIVGFPGETEEEWATTKAFISQIDFGHMHIFSFSGREGTKAARLPNQILGEVKKTRSKELHVIAADLKAQFFNKFVNREFDVLWESDFDQLEDGNHRFWGHTPNYIKVAIDVPNSVDLSQRIVRVKLNGVALRGDFMQSESVLPVENLPQSTRQVINIKHLV
jgi:threonylcarbamoyladenosine tRNA methylthiotransferase MtaB